MRKAKVYYKEELAGYLLEAEEGYTFLYTKSFLEKGIPVSLSLPLQKEPFVSQDLFPFFKGLLPEGWYLNIVTATQKVDLNDAFGILLSTASKDTIGAVTIVKDEE